jgi:hypothetical protein
LKTLVGVQLLPVFNEFVVKLRELYDANVDVIRAHLIEWAARLRKVLRDLMNPASELRKSIDEVAAGFMSFVAKVGPVVDWMGGPLCAALGLVAAVTFGPLIAAVANLSVAMIGLGVTIMATPIGWILAGLAAIAAIAYVLYQKWDEFAAYWSGLWGRVKDAFDQGFIQGVATLLMEFNPVTHIMRGINAVIEYFTGVDLGEYGAAMIRTLAAGIDTGTLALAQFITGGVASAWAAYEAWWDSFSASVRAAGAEIVNALWEGLKSAWGNVVSWMRGAIADLIGWLPESIQSRLGFTIEGGVSPSNDNVARAGEAIDKMVGRTTAGIPTGASESAVMAANQNTPNGGGRGGIGGGDVENSFLTNSDNTTNTTMNTTFHITATPGAEAGEIARIVRQEYEAAVRRQRLNDRHGNSYALSD